MEINKYALFADVAETKSFTKSAERMGYTQPGVSHVLKTMEQELGFALFLRTKTGVMLTQEAKRILPYVKKMLAEHEQLEQTIASVNGLSKGHLTISCFSSISRQWLPSIIYAFRQDYPGIEIELLEGGTDDIVTAVEDSSADLGLMSKRHANMLTWTPLCEDPLVAILPPVPPYTEMTSFPLSQMKEQPFIISAEGTDYDVHAVLKKEEISPITMLSSKDDCTIISMVASRLGLSILPKLVAENTARQVITLPLSPHYSRELGIGTRPQSTLSPAAEKFIRYIREFIRTQTDRVCLLQE